MNKFNKALDQLTRGIAELESEGNPELCWLKTEFIEMLQEGTNRRELRLDYEQDQQEEEVLNPWLREMTNLYFKN